MNTRLPLFTESSTCLKRRKCRRCRSELLWRVTLLNAYSLPGDDVNFTCPHGVPWPDGKAPPPGARSSFGRAIINLATGVMSIGKTQVLRIDRVDDDTFRARLAVCASCPEAVTKGGKPHRCGPMYESWKRESGVTCGCLLSGKARDRKQACPQGKWPPPPQDQRVDTTVGG